MIDTTKLDQLKKLGVLAGVAILLVVAYGLGARDKTVKQAAQTPKVVETAKEAQLTQEVVKDFLVAYYTKKELEANRKLYKPFMTDSLYQQEISLEADPINQAYKGYVVDFKFQTADIYIDDTQLTALVKVRYTNTLLAEKGNYDKAQKDVVNEVDVKLTYVKQNGKYLLNQKTPLVLSFPFEEEVSYPDYGTSLPETIPTTEETNGQENNS